MAAVEREVPPAASCSFDTGTPHVSLPTSHLVPGLDGGIELPKLVREVQSYVSLNSADINAGRLHHASHNSLSPPASGSVCLMRSDSTLLTRVGVGNYGVHVIHPGCMQESELIRTDNIHHVHVAPTNSNLLTSVQHDPTLTKYQCSNCTSSSADINSDSHPCNHKPNHTRALSSDSIHQSSPTCRRRILTDVEKNLTFRPKLNEYSLKIAARSSRHSVPVVHRLLEARRNAQSHQDPRLTFAPKLNSLSVKLAQERNARMPEVQARMAQLAESRKAEALSEYTFKPQMSQRSHRIALSLGTSFQTRQIKQLERKRRREMENAYKVTPPAHSRRIIKLTPRVPHTVSHNPNTSDSSDSSGSDPISSRLTTSDTAESEPDVQQHSTSTSSSSSTHSPRGHRLRRHHTNTSPGGVHLKRRRANSAGAPSRAEKSKTVSKKEAGKGDLHSGSNDLAKQERLLFSKDFSRLSDGEKVKRIKICAERKRKSKKIFLICGSYRRIRKCLRKRGWVELEYQRFLQSHHQPNKGSVPSSPDKRTSKKEAEVSCVRSGGKCESVGGGGDSDNDDDGNNGDGDGNVSEDEYSDEEEYQLLSRAVRNCNPHFVWTLKRDDIIYHSLNKDAIINHFIGASSFTTKVGICTHLRNVVWFGDTHPNTFFPRCYLLSSNEDKQAFIEDYRLTAALCILKRLPTQYTTVQPPEHVESSLPPAAEESSTTGTETSSQPSTNSTSPVVLPEEAVQLAMRAVKAFLSSLEHEDIEGSQHQLCPKLSECEWDTLIKYFYAMVFEKGKVFCSSYMITNVNDILQEVETHFPQLHMDGSRNVWIVKPGAKSRGRGIMCMDRLESILELVSSSVVRNEGKWVIQKYIERPLLVSDTKFDIRQWFLVTDWNPLTMWMYKESYVRFSSQKFTLDDLDQSIHLCNNSVQKYYENASSRDSLLPAENMWDSERFKLHLSSIGEGTLWDSVIYPEMKQALIHVLQVSQDETEHRKNSFELYGADFMISSDYRPWLIEINASPSMEASTDVTTRLCKQVLEDTLKVVLDRREDKECDIGMFELAYKQPKLDLPSYVGIQLCVQGSSIPKPRSYTLLQKKPSIVRTSTNNTTDRGNTSSTTVPPSSPPKASSSNSASKSEHSHNIVSPVRDHRPQSRAASRSAASGRVSIVEINCKLPEMRVC